MNKPEAFAKLCRLAKKRHGQDPVGLPGHEDDLVNGYVFDSEINMHMLHYHLPGNKSSYMVMIDDSGAQIK